MTNNELTNNLALIRMALNGVLVQGKDNLGKLFGSISALDDLIQELSAAPEGDEKGE